MAQEAGPTAWDDEICPARVALTHSRNDEGRCNECGANVRIRTRETAIAQRHAPEPPRFAPVPRYLFGEYEHLHRHGQTGTGLDDREAQALVALRHGLRPTGGLPWTLRELAGLEAVAAWTASGRVGS